MRPEYADLIARRLEVPVVEGPDKVLPLAEAIRRFIAPGQTIYVGAAHGRPNALVRELVRQWWGKQPDWTLALTGFGSPWTALAVGGLVRRLITTFVGEGYPFPVPQALVGPELLGRPDQRSELVHADAAAAGAGRGHGGAVPADPVAARLVDGRGQRARG